MTTAWLAGWITGLAYRHRVARRHRQDRCWNCGSLDHYSEGCPYD